MSNALEVMLLTEHSQCKSSQANRLYALVRVEALGRPDSKRAVRSAVSRQPRRPRQTPAAFRAPAPEAVYPEPYR